MSRKKTQNRTNIILERISEQYHLENDAAMGAFYGVSESTVSSWRTRDSINEALIRAKCNDDNLANWFLNGIKTSICIAEPNAAYMAPSSESEIKTGKLVDKTIDILKSGSVYCYALKSNIEAFHHAMSTEEKLTVANQRIDNLEKEIMEIKARLPAVGE